MTAHMAVPAFEPSALPATVSEHVLTGLLKDELGFKGLIVTDAMDMQGIASLFTQGDAAVRAIEAGADVLLMPSEPEACIRALESAVRSGRIPVARINASAAKVMAAKKRLQLTKHKLVDLDKLSDRIKEPKLDALATRVAEQAFTLVKDDAHLFPISEGGACLVIVQENEFSQRGATLVRDLSRQLPDLKMYVADASDGRKHSKRNRGGCCAMQASVRCRCLSQWLLTGEVSACKAHSVLS